jgi:hypothetical protein
MDSELHRQHTRRASWDTHAQHEKKETRHAGCEIQGPQVNLAVEIMHLQTSFAPPCAPTPPPQSIPSMRNVRYTCMPIRNRHIRVTATVPVRATPPSMSPCAASRKSANLHCSANLETRRSAKQPTVTQASPRRAPEHLEARAVALPHHHSTVW